MAMSEQSQFPTLHPYLSGNTLVCADNIDVLRELPAESVDLIYLDPPFNSNHNYVAVFGDKGSVDAQLRDIWRWTVESETQYQRLPEGSLRNAVNAVRLVRGNTSRMAAYALFMGRRLVELHRVLKSTGSIYLHCDPTASHYLKMLMDAVFGDANFRNEITWVRSVPHNDARRFGRSHDTILFYGRSDSAEFYPQYVPQKASSVKAHYREDENGRMYQLTSLIAPGGRGSRPLYGFGGFERNWRFTQENMAALESKGRIRHEPGKLPRRIQYLDESKGALIQDHWGDINPINSMAKERLGYPTQKPEALLERIINTSSAEGDIVLDPFCGCGTAADAAAKLGRGYLGIDVSAIAVRVMEQRLASRGGSATPVVYKMRWEDYEWEDFERRALMHGTDAEDGLPGWAWAEDKVAGLLNAVPNGKKVSDGGVDARYFTEAKEIIPIQVKMHQGQIGRPDLDRLLGVQTSWQHQKVEAPMSLMITLYPPRETLRVYARQQGDVTLRGKRYPRMQVLSVQEMLTKQTRPKLPPVDPRYFVGNTQTRLAMAT